MIEDIQIAFYQRTCQRYYMMAPNIYLDWKLGEMDLLGLRPSGYIDEVEIKLSRSDFIADFNKTVLVGNYKRLKHDALKAGESHCNYFSFLMSHDLVEKCTIPEYAGLYVFKTDNLGTIRVEEKKKAPLLHKRKISETLKHEVGKKMAFRYWHTIQRLQEGWFN